MLAGIIEKLSSFVFRFLKGYLPITLISFLIVGSLGVIVHMAVLNMSLYTWAPSFRWANSIAMLVAASFNYFTNNKATFSVVTLTGRRWIFGYFIYLFITSVGLGVSLIVSGEVYDEIHMPMVSALAGIVVGSLWNYFMSYKFVWKLLSRRTAAANG
ncbi:GtrA family protein [Xanthomonas citri]|uniref:GtrA family protein n=1 Tax=Xanthomonas citri TaxID=346 RepID=UPI0018DF2603|nr:GtrA family protein [Xanthomonas citri]